MHFSFQHPTGFRESNYDVVDALADADFAIVDADSSPAVKGVLQSGRVAQAVFVGGRAPVGAASHLPRPIDPRRILQTLDELTTRPPPMLPTPEVVELPTLDDVVALFDTEPGAAPAPSAPASRDALHNAAKAAARTAAR
ncbi:MAG TPA: hypothetical protein VNU71_00245, partial [Burkholderiaceae bacterium]|nr:hypothetical protein [Burkholderiaceae bacterium]